MSLRRPFLAIEVAVVLQKTFFAIFSIKDDHLKDISNNIEPHWFSLYGHKINDIFQNILICNDMRVKNYDRLLFWGQL